MNLRDIVYWVAIALLSVALLFSRTVERDLLEIESRRAAVHKARAEKLQEDLIQEIRRPRLVHVDGATCEYRCSR